MKLSQREIQTSLPSKEEARFVRYTLLGRLFNVLKAKKDRLLLINLDTQYRTLEASYRWFSQGLKAMYPAKAGWHKLYERQLETAIAESYNALRQRRLKILSQLCLLVDLD